MKIDGLLRVFWRLPKQYYTINELLDEIPLDMKTPIASDILHMFQHNYITRRPCDRDTGDRSRWEYSLP